MLTKMHRITALESDERAAEENASCSETASHVRFVSNCLGSAPIEQFCHPGGYDPHNTAQRCLFLLGLC